MKHWKQLGVPVTIGLVAAALNWYSVSSKIQPTAYVAVRQHVDPGDTITEQMLEKLEINGDHGLSRAGLLWEQRSMLFGWRASRRLQKGSLILRRDVVPDRASIAPDEHEFVVNVSEFETPPDLYEDSYLSFALTKDDRYQHTQPDAGRFGTPTKENRFIGPFRVVAITYQSSDKTTAAGTPRVDAITLVVSKAEEGRERMERLLRAFHRNGDEHVLAIVRESPAREDETDEYANVDAAVRDSKWEG